MPQRKKRWRSDLKPGALPDIPMEESLLYLTQKKKKKKIKELMKKAEAGEIIRLT